MAWNRRANQYAGAGFTFLEVLLAILLLGVLLALAMPRVTSHLDANIQESAERLRSLIHLTRAAAMRDGVRYRLQFPGAPNPDDPNAERIVEVMAVTQQPTVTREYDPVNEPGAYADADMYYDVGNILMQGVRCIAVRLGGPSFDVNNNSPFAGPEISNVETQMDTVTFNPDGSCDWATFTLTNMNVDQELQPEHISRILNVIVDGRTGQTWFQRPFRNEEKQLLDEYGATPLLHQDFVTTEELTEDNILHVQVNVEREAIRKN